MGEEAVDPLYGSLGEDGREESVISSMSEWEDADLGDFFFPNACLKELRSCGINKSVTMTLFITISASGYNPFFMFIFKNDPFKMFKEYKRLY